MLDNKIIYLKKQLEKEAITLPQNLMYAIKI